MNNIFVNNTYLCVVTLVKLILRTPVIFTSVFVVTRHDCTLNALRKYIAPWVAQQHPAHAHCAAPITYLAWAADEPVALIPWSRQLLTDSPRTTLQRILLLKSKNMLVNKLLLLLLIAANAPKVRQYYAWIFLINLNSFIKNFNQQRKQMKIWKVVFEIK